jgi:hypothetical protein
MQNYVHNFSHISKFLQNEISNAMYISSYKELVFKTYSTFYLGSFRKRVGEPTSWSLTSPGLKGLRKTMTNYNQ